MALTRIPWSLPESPAPLAAKPLPPREPEFRPLLLDMRTRRERRRMQWALWVSLAVHGALLLAASLLPLFLPRESTRTARADLLRDRNLTYLEAPPDTPPAKKKPDTNIISDKDREAASRKPTIDKKTLDEILAAGRPGPPGPAGPPASSTPSVPARSESASRGEAEPLGPREQSSPVQQKPVEGQTAQLQAPPEAARQGRGFGGGMSPGSALEQAARAAAASRGGLGGAMGDFGLGRGASGVSTGQAFDVLSDTMGVDFGPYLQRVVHQVRLNWYNLIPEVARAPLRKKGKVSIEFAILKDGGVAGMKLVTPSGDVSLDRAAWGGITASNPFPPLPAEFPGQYLYLRFHFYYNPEGNELR
jgi:TonB family protein